ncbi:MAG TPA: AbrB/MazE/SpoVT family DNA-binding domain-containing protein [Longimicrobium sp.]|jgi:AbrB family looped-hinge helix DNA binding protein
MPTARLSSKSQIVIPVEIRRKLGIEPGDELLLETEDDRIVIRKSTQSALELLESLPKEIWKNAAEEIQRMRDEWER